MSEIIKALAMLVVFTAMFAAYSYVSVVKFDMQDAFNACAFYALIRSFEKPKATCDGEGV